MFSREVAWANYIRISLMVGEMFKFDALPTNTWFLAREKKSFAGRERRIDGKAIGRSLSVTFFELSTTNAQGHQTNLCSLACTTELGSIILISTIALPMSGVHKGTLLEYT